VFVTGQGRPAAHLQNVLRNPRASATTILAAAHDVPHINLADALAITLRLRGHNVYPRAAARWIARLILEREGVMPEEVDLAVDAFAELEVAPEASEKLRR
jgi:hypothetical protein